MNKYYHISDDFKPASVDTNQESTVVIGDDSSVEVTVPLMQVPEHPITIIPIYYAALILLVNLS